MTLLRLRVSLVEQPLHCQWVLFKDGRETLAGSGSPADLPAAAKRVELIIPAPQVLITRARLPPAARRQTGSLLAYAVEEETLGEADANQVSWLGRSDDEDLLAVLDKRGLARWLAALQANAIRAPQVYCETLSIPWVAGQWSLLWDGREGVVRSARLEGAATDCGDRQAPPLALRLWLDAAQARGVAPQSIALYLTPSATAPDLAAWEQQLGTPLQLAGPWQWQLASPSPGSSLTPPPRRWQLAPISLRQLRPAAWIAALALAVHAGALLTDWTRLAGEQASLRQAMEARFRASFPEAVAVTDPALQMRRQLSQARQRAGETDSSDFLPLIEQLATAGKDLPAGSVRAVAYEGERLRLEIAALDEATLAGLIERLQGDGLSVDVPAATARTAGAKLTLILYRR